jgi:hypothetical protein
MEAFVDQIGGGTALLLLGEHGERRLEVPLALLPSGVREGDVVEILDDLSPGSPLRRALEAHRMGEPIEALPAPLIIPQPDKTRAARNDIAALRAALSKRSPSTPGEGPRHEQ